MEIKNQSKHQHEIARPIQFMMPETVLTRFSNFALIQRDKEFFTISFFEIQKPAIIGNPEEKRAIIEKLESVPAVCVARIVATPSHFKDLIEAMKNNLEGFERDQDMS